MNESRPNLLGARFAALFAELAPAFRGNWSMMPAHRSDATEIPLTPDTRIFSWCKGVPEVYKSITCSVLPTHSQAHQGTILVHQISVDHIPAQARRARLGAEFVVLLLEL